MIGKKYFGKFVLNGDLISKQAKEIDANARTGIRAISPRNIVKSVPIILKAFRGPATESEGRSLYTELFSEVPVSEISGMTASCRRASLIWLAFTIVLGLFYAGFLVAAVIQGDLIRASFNLLGVIPVAGCAAMAASFRLRAEIMKKKRVMGLREAMGWK